MWVYIYIYILCAYMLYVYIYIFMFYMLYVYVLFGIYMFYQNIYIIYIWKYIFYIFYTSCQLFSLSRTPILGDKQLGAHVIEEPTAPVVLIMWEHVSQLQNIWADFPNSDAREFPDDKIQHAWIRFIRQDSRGSVDDVGLSRVVRVYPKKRRRCRH